MSQHNHELLTNYTKHLNAGIEATEFYMVMFFGAGVGFAIVGTIMVLAGVA